MPSTPERSSRGSRLGSLALRPFGEVRPEEVKSTLALTATVFLILMAYYLLKVVREPLILQGSGAEVKSYASVGQVALLVVVTRAYAWLSKRMGRMPLSTAVFLFFAACVLGFFGLSSAGVTIGVPFYLFVGIFNLTVIAQFWSFANDVHTPEEGKRLFAIVGIGSSVGAVAGAKLAGKLFDAMGVGGLMMLTVGFLLLSLGGLWLVDRTRAAKVAAAGDDAPPSSKQPPDSKAGALLGSTFDRYLWLIAAMMLLLNCVNSLGEYSLDRSLLEAASNLHQKDEVQRFIADFKSSYFGWVNGIGVCLQLFVASRLLKYFGVRVALLVLPVVALGGYSVAAVAPALTAIFVAKIAENSVDYSIQSTTQQALYLVTSREAKYAAKNFIDTFVVRFGDVTAACLVLLGTHLGFSTRGFVVTNLLLLGAWLTVVVLLGRENARRAEGARRVRPSRPEVVGEPA